MMPSEPAEPMFERLDQAPPMRPRQPMPIVALVRQFLEGNFFYVISALLMIAGCYLLMQQSPADGGEFGHVLRTLALLQGYELLVIVTSVLIVWRLRRMDDALTLLAVELALLFDPTFFANNFLTLAQSDRETDMGAWVNGACWALVPVKLLVLQRFLHLRISARTWAAVVVVGGLIYMAPLGLAQKDHALEPHGWFYGMLWCVPLLALVAPANGRLVAIGGDESFASARQRQLLPRMMLALPAAVLVLHLGESLWVHNLAFFSSYVAPFTVALAVRVLMLGGNHAVGWRLAGIDLLMLVAIGTSALRWHRDWPEVHNVPAAFLMEGLLPIAIAALAAAAVYVGFWRRYAEPAALLRLAVMAVGGGAAWAWHRGAVAWAVTQAELAGTATLEWMTGNPVFVGWIVWIALAALALRFVRFGTWLWLGVYSIWFALYLAGPFDVPPVAEVLQAVLLLFLGLDHRFNAEGSAAQRVAVAVFVLAAGCIRLNIEPAWDTAGVQALVACGIMVAGAAVGYRSYMVAGGLALATQAAIMARPTVASMQVSPGAVTVAIGLVVFAAGIAVTFHKARLLAWLDRWT